MPHLHGHNGRAVITIESATARRARAWCSTSRDIKRVVSSWIDENLDHRMILHRDDPVVPVLQQLGEPVYLIDVNPTAENIARLIFDFTREPRVSRSSRRSCGRRRDCFATYRG